MKQVGDRKYYFEEGLSLFEVRSIVSEVIGDYYGSDVAHHSVLGEMTDVFLDIRSRLYDGTYVQVVIRYNANLRTWVASFDKVD